ncbi:MAG: hypothetical protein WB565_18075 [Acidimicrobiales bacterium]
MEQTDSLQVALIRGDQIIAFTADTAAVRVAAAMIKVSLRDPDPVTAPITLGRRAACRAIAAGSV